jgi:NADPH:quinone reductase-like Zn-dependent oxidoreductase
MVPDAQLGRSHHSGASILFPMNAAIVDSFDAPPRYGSFEDPVPTGKEQVVNVTAAGLHRIVKALANGTHYGSTTKPPFIPGLDGVGRLSDGTRVYFGASRSPFGSFAERTVAGFTFHLPEGLDDATAAGIANPAMSSWAALKLRAQFIPGESVLILGATGVAGRLAIQIAKRLGAKRVVAAGRDPEGLAELGADAVIPIDRDAFRSERCDIVLDYLWGQPAEILIDAISQKGLQQTTSRVRYLQIGSAAGPRISFAAEALRSSGLEMYGSGFGSVPIEKILASVGDFLVEASSKPFKFKLKAVPLRDVETLWNDEERLVFQP